MYLIFQAFHAHLIFIFNIQLMIKVPVNLREGLNPGWQTKDAKRELEIEVVRIEMWL